MTTSESRAWATLLHQACPGFGADRDAAIEAGVDVFLLPENLQLSPTERLEQLQRRTELYEALRPREQADATDA